MSEAHNPDSDAGHRRRLRDKFMKSGLGALHDYEVVELLLTLATPRRDCKQAAKEAIQHFKGLRGVLEASPAELEGIPGIGPINSFGIRLIREIAGQYLLEKTQTEPYCNSSQSVYDYLYQDMMWLKVETFKVLYLNSQNRILKAEDLFTGTVNASAVFSREVVKKALKYHATALIFVHNHPSGNPAPSQADKSITRDLMLAAATVDIEVLDHIIIGNKVHFSFATEGLLTGYHKDIKRLKSGMDGFGGKH